jgi:hypothetical protein
MAWRTLDIFKRRKKTIVDVDSSYDEIQRARVEGKITVAYAFGLIQEKNRRSQALVQSKDQRPGRHRNPDGASGV